MYTGFELHVMWPRRGVLHLIVEIDGDVRELVGLVKEYLAGGGWLATVRRVRAAENPPDRLEAGQQAQWVIEQATGTVAAPLLAGFTITLIGLVVDTSNDGIRHRDTALLILMATVASLLAAIQCAYSARRYMVLPDELTSWWPGVMEETQKSQLRQVQNEQFAHRLLHTQWADLRDNLNAHLKRAGGAFEEGPARRRAASVGAIQDPGELPNATSPPAACHPNRRRS